MSQTFLSRTLSTTEVTTTFTNLAHTVTFPPIDVTGYTSVRVSLICINTDAGSPYNGTFFRTWWLEKAPAIVPDLLESDTFAFGSVITFKFDVKARFFSPAIGFPVTVVPSTYQLNTFLLTSSGPSISLDNVGSGAEIFIPNDDDMRTLVSGDSSVTITQNPTEIDFSVPLSGLAASGSQGHFYFENFAVPQTIAIAAASTPVPIDVSYTVNADLPGDWNTATAGEVEYLGAPSRSYVINYSINALKIDAGGEAYEFEIEVDTGGGFVAIAGSKFRRTSNNSASRTAGSTIRVTMNTNDKLRMTVANLDSDTDLDIQQLSITYTAGATVNSNALFFFKDLVTPYHVVIPGSGTPVVLAMALTEDAVIPSDWNSPAAGEIEYLGSATIRFEINYAFTSKLRTPNTGIDIEVQTQIDTGGGFVDILLGECRDITRNEYRTQSLCFPQSLSTNDKLRFTMANNTNSADIDLGGIFICISSS